MYIEVLLGISPSSFKKINGGDRGIIGHIKKIIDKT